MTYRQTYPHEIPDDIPSYISNTEPVPVQELVLVDDHVDPAVTVHPKGEVSYVKPNGDVYKALRAGARFRVLRLGSPCHSSLFFHKIQKFKFCTVYCHRQCD